MRNYSFNNNKIYGGPIEEIFGSDDGFALFLNGMGFKTRLTESQLFKEKTYLHSAILMI